MLKYYKSDKEQRKAAYDFLHMLKAMFNYSSVMALAIDMDTPKTTLESYMAEPGSTSAKKSANMTTIANGVHKALKDNKEWENKRPEIMKAYEDHFEM